MRPAYERQSDVDSEREVMDHMVSLFPRKMTYSKMPKAYQVDYGVYGSAGKKELVMVCEVKTRTVSRNKYPSMILSAHKMHELINWSTRGVQARLLYRLTDGLYVYAVDANSYDLQIKEGGRTDRNDWQDVEPVYHVPAASLCRVLGWPS